MIYSLFLSLTDKLNQIDQKLSSSGKIIPSRKKEIKKLIELLNKFNPYLLDAEEKQFVDEELSEFLGIIKHVAYEARDLSDDILHQQQQDNDKRGKVLDSFSNFFPDLNWGVKLRLLIKKLGKLEKQIPVFELNETPVNCETIHGHRLDEFCRGHEEKEYYCIGRESDKNLIFNKLFEENSGFSGLKVISIFGKGGLGKTTLAQSVYNDPNVQLHFGTKIWVSVPNTPVYLRIIVVKILEALSISDFGGDLRGSDIAQLLSVLSKCMKQRKFLIVLDDVWDENFEKWDSLKQSLQSGAPGSSIMIVTHNKGCAYLMSTTTLHELKPLSKDCAWELFRRTAFPDPDDDAALKPFDDIGREVSLYCTGVPLALTCLGGLMRTKTTTQEWVDVVDSDTWELLEMQPFLPALCFSYYALPPHLKLCLAYTVTFPKAHLIDKEMLVRMWMAEGFLGSSLTKDWEPELLGDQFVKELTMRSLFTACGKGKNGSITHLKMHDLLHDLLISMCGDSVAQVNCSSLESSKARHVSVIYSNLDSIGVSIGRKAKHVSTLKFFECTAASRKISPNMFQQMRHLRVLDLSYLRLEEIPSQVGGLRLLRYLGLSHAKLSRLPEKLCNLRELQTLILSGCEELVELPSRLGELCSLRHLDIDNTPKLRSLPPGIQRLLASLPRLSKFPDSLLSERPHELKGYMKTSFQSSKIR
ncbi:putative disease resistance protein RGA3 [Papaver somniferum]|uniref:putative disease resistance protein RGA3 n=1 Tax=Papaver somniferum TaxID=3469 RepID=UPI000E6F7E88|nr:putative disease resistance protein RGA3 [Papaver somniferum]